MIFFWKKLEIARWEYIAIISVYIYRKIHYDITRI